MMTDSTFAAGHGTLDRIAAWWKGDAPTTPRTTVAAGASATARKGRTDAPAAAATTRRAADRMIGTQIMAFLADHDLSPTEECLLIARRYVVGEDRNLVDAIDARIREHQRVSPGFVSDLFAAEQPERLRPEALIELADILTTRLAESHQAITRSCDSARDYNAALTSEANSATIDPQACIERLMTLTTAAVEQSHQLAQELDQTRRETGRLRQRLHVARRAADQDHLTGLPNRRSFDARLLGRGARTAMGQAPRCVALCDVDDFKRINDVHGHDVGDRVLKLVAQHLKSALGPKVMVARHGGEEFACLFDGKTPADAQQALDRARQTLSERHFVNQDSGLPIGQVTFSAGLAAVIDHPRDAMRAADAALYMAKRDGKDRIIVDPG